MATSTVCGRCGRSDARFHQPITISHNFHSSTLMVDSCSDGGLLVAEGVYRYGDRLAIDAGDDGWWFDCKFGDDGLFRHCFCLLHLRFSGRRAYCIACSMGL